MNWSCSMLHVMRGNTILAAGANRFLQRNYIYIIFFKYCVGAWTQISTDAEWFSLIWMLFSPAKCQTKTTVWKWTHSGLNTKHWIYHLFTHQVSRKRAIEMRNIVPSDSFSLFFVFFINLNVFVAYLNLVHINNIKRLKKEKTSKSCLNHTIGKEQ